MRHFRILVAGLAVCLSLAACVSAQRPPTPAEELQQAARQSRVVHRETQAALTANLAQRVQMRGDRRLDILLLSGGGQHGAYGAGFLRGWQSHPTAPMPRFDLVTGVSTGALQTAFALLGNEADLQQACELYLSAADRISPSFDWWFWLKSTGGVLDTSRYVRSVHETLSPALAQRLGAEFAQGREIAIGTSDFELGTGRVWRVSQEMAAAEGLARVHSIFIASSAIPGAFAPVLLDGRVHADGGIVSNLLVAPDREGYALLADSLRTAGVREPVTVHLWVVMNLWTHPKPQSLDPGSVLAMSRRTATMLFWAQQPQLLQGLRDMARSVSADHPGLKVEVHVTTIPSELATEPGADKLFDRAWMERLEALGHARALSATPWDEPSNVYMRPLPAALPAAPASAPGTNSAVSPSASPL
ncbi:patatin-like phospholipase family protein [Caldimonas brevitalea]|uniref:Lipoprotein n=1 Tax=Caldimonas brevitalea TaxID=413882 RepID=A0A0G3BJI4_9BURK|nr:patatin-like phospholipase family protein [Caldimonas brevitalea]AKJ27536.1 lipoprotein [Caldimonas brevitalea]